VDRKHFLYRNRVIKEVPRREAVGRLRLEQIGGQIAERLREAALLTFLAI